MFCNCALHRRGVFKLAGGFAAALGLGVQRIAQAQPAPPALTGSGGPLPARGEFVVRGGHVLTMDVSLGDLPGGDVHVRDGAIVAVGTNISAPQRAGDRRSRHDRDAGLCRDSLASVVHRIAARSCAPTIRTRDISRPRSGSAAISRRRIPTSEYGSALPRDSLSGITTVHDWSHNTVSPAACRRRNSGAEGHRNPRPFLLRHRTRLPGRQDNGSRRSCPRPEGMERGRRDADVRRLPAHAGPSRHARLNSGRAVPHGV